MLFKSPLVFGVVQFVSGASQAGNAKATAPSPITLIDDANHSGSETDPFELFVPVESRGGATSNLDFFSVGCGATRDVLTIPNISSDTLANNIPFVSVALTHNESVQKNVVIAVQTGSNYTVIARSFTNLSTGTAELIQLTFSNICSEATCTEIGTQETVANTMFSESILFAAWVVDTSDTTTIDDTTWTTTQLGDLNAIFIDIKFSSQVDTTNSPLIEEVAKGDTVLPITFNRGSVNTTAFPLADIHKVLMIEYGTNGAQGASTMEAIESTGGLTCNFSIAETDPIEGGTVKLTALENGKDFDVAIAFKNVYGFISLFSPSSVGQTRAIETFLQEQACFLLSAGFQTEHYVIDYFREFRDNVLLNYEWGRIFVDYYYEIAPEYTHYVYNNPVLSFVVKVLGFMAYYFMKLKLYYLLPLATLGAFILTLRKRSIAV